MQLFRNIPNQDLNEVLRFPTPPQSEGYRWNNELEHAVTIALTRPVPLSSNFNKGFCGPLAKLEPAQIVMLWFQDLSVLHLALESLGDAQNADESELIKLIAWRGYMQAMYAIWLARSCGIYMRMSETQDGFTRIETTMSEQPGFTQACTNLANTSEIFTITLKKIGEVVDPVDAMSEVMGDAIETLGVVERSCFFSYSRCNDDDDDETTNGFADMAKAAFLVRSIVTDWLLKGIKGFSKTKPLNERLKLNTSKFNKFDYKQLQVEVVQTLENMSLGLLLFQFLTDARNIIAHARESK